MAQIAALIVKVAADTAELRANMEKATKTIETGAKALVGAWSAKQVFDAVTSYVASVANAASETVALAAKTGMSVDALQRMDFVAKQTNATLSNFTDAAFKLGNNLASGSGSVRASIEKLGLSYNTIMAMRPDDRFIAVATALGKVEDSTKRNLWATELFGKGAAAILPAIAQGYTDIAKNARVATDDQLRALSDASDAWAKFVRDRQTDATNILGSFVLAGEGAKKRGLLNTLALMIQQGPLATSTLAAVGAAARQTAKDIDLPGPPIDPIRNYREELERLKSAAEELSPAQRELAEEALNLGQTLKQVAEGLMVDERSIGAFVEMKKQAKEAEAAADRLKKAWRDLYHDMRMFGVEQIQAMTVEVQTEMARQRDAVLNAQMTIVGRLTASQAKLREMSGDAMTGVDAEIAALQKRREADIAHIEHLGRQAAQGSAGWREHVQKELDNTEAIFQREFAALVQKSTEGMSGVAGAVAGSASQMKSAADAAAQPIVSSFKSAFMTIVMEARSSAQMIRDAMVMERDAEINMQRGDPSGMGFFQLQRAANLRTQAGTRASFERIPGFANGVQHFRGGPAIVGERGPELVNLPGGSSVTPNHKLGGHTINVYVTGGADPKRTGRAVGEAVVAELRARGQRV